jgi:hypothetical protein
MKHDVPTLRLILTFPQMAVSVTSTQLQCSLHHADTQEFIKLMARTFKNTVILRNLSGAISLNTGTTERVSAKSIETRSTS